MISIEINLLGKLKIYFIILFTIQCNNRLLFLILYIYYFYCVILYEFQNNICVIRPSVLKDQQRNSYNRYF